MVCNDIACLLPIRNDYDIVYKHLVYYYNIGCRNFYILIHCGDDRDRKEVDRFKVKSEANVEVIIDNDPAYNQDKQYMKLSHAAKGHKWHVMSDTDELLILKKHKTLRDYFAGKDYDCIRFKWYAYVDVTGNDIFQWSHRCSKVYDPNTKAAMRYKPGLTWSWGHHHINGKASCLMESSDNAFYGHFILRDYKMWKQRKLDFADAKRKRFGDSQFWMKQCHYHEIKNDPKFLEERFKKGKRKYYNCDLIYDPIPPELFVLG